jgi:glycosyltransferase involved in cell wall biosynthesis
MPRFSVILIHYQGVISHREFWRCYQSLANQTYQDFELLVYHDGPLLDASLALPVEVRCMDRRYNDYGHSLRDRGIREAAGDYIVHMNADNLLYPNALEEISATIDRAPRIFSTQNHQPLDTDNIIIYGILSHNMMRLGNQAMKTTGHPEWQLILSGNPPRRWYIDAMQLVMKRSLWLAEGGWYDKTLESDGVMYEKFAAKYGYRSVEKILGEHF